MQQASGTLPRMQLVREQIHKAWDGLDDAEIDRSGGSIEKLVELISRKTGTPRAEIRRELRRIFTG